MQPVDDPAHAFGRIVLHVPHVGLDDQQRELRDHLVELLHAFLVGRDLRLDVVDVLKRVACGVFCAVEQLIKCLLAETAAVDQLEIIDVDALLLDGDGVGRHRAG